MPLRRSDPADPGWSRRGLGEDTVFLDEQGLVIRDPEAVGRCRALVLPPAWDEVWICPDPDGHIQATGVDAKGRLQYRYHDRWREERDLAKFERVTVLAARLPRAREQIAADLARPGMPREKVLAAAARLLDLGFFRIGSEEYAASNESFGLATMERRHVRVDRSNAIHFEYVGKHGKERIHTIADPELAAVVRTLKRRRDPSPDLLAWRDRNGSWHDVRSGDINAYLHELMGDDWSAKDFRTWSATVLAAVGLAVSAGVDDDERARQRAIARVVAEVASYLGNTPAVARSSYIDPRVIEAFEEGRVVDRALVDLGRDTQEGHLAIHGRCEAAVLRLLSAQSTATPKQELALAAPG